MGASTLPDGRAKPRQRLPELLVADLGQRGCDTVRRCMIRHWRLRPLAAAERRLPQPQVDYRLPAEEPVDPFEDDLRKVLDLDGGRALDPQHEGAGLLVFVLERPRPLD